MNMKPVIEYKLYCSAKYRCRRGTFDSPAVLVLDIQCEQYRQSFGIVQEEEESKLTIKTVWFILYVSYNNICNGHL